MAGFGNYIAPMLVGAPDNNKANILQHRVLGQWLARLGMVTFGFLIRSMLPHTTSLSTWQILPLDLALAQALRVHRCGYVRILKGIRECDFTI